MITFCIALSREKVLSLIGAAYSVTTDCFQISRSHSWSRVCDIEWFRARKNILFTDFVAARAQASRPYQIDLSSEYALEIIIHIPILKQGMPDAGKIIDQEVDVALRREII